MLKPDAKKTKWALSILAVLVLAVGVLTAIALVTPSSSSSGTLRFGSQDLKLITVNTPELQAKGLSGRASLGEDTGMLFAYDGDALDRCFWMKDMRFAIDMIWINSRQEVVAIAERVEPDTYPKTFCNEVPAQYVLEVNAGLADEAGISPGSRIQFR